MRTQGNRRSQPIAAGAVGKHRDWRNTAVAVTAVLSLLLTLAQMGGGLWNRHVSGERDRAKREAQAFLLGRRVSVYASRNAQIAALTSVAVLPESAASRQGALNELLGSLGGDDMAIAASRLGLGVSAHEEPWNLDSRLEGQLEETFDGRTLAAYRLGRLLGSYDPRAVIVVNRGPRGVVFSTCEELASGEAHTRWLGGVDSLLKTLMLSEHSAPAAWEGRWRAAMESRELLNRLAGELMARAEGRKHANVERADPSGREFQTTLVVAAGVYGSQSVPQVWWSMLTQQNDSQFDAVLHGN